LVFVHGDTTTSTATALAAFYLQIPVVHIEAGLRTHNIYSPWPEEMNRQITSRIATYHFAPTDSSKANLERENIATNNIFVTGNTVIDALMWVTEKIQQRAELKKILTRQLITCGYDVERLNTGRRLILITGHRRENFGTGFIQICRAIKNIADKYPQVDFVYPVHLNPNVQNPVKQILGDEFTGSNVFLIEPLDYLPFVYLMSLSYLLLTDSGGIQEEAPSLGKPVLVMRDTTERPEAVEAGTVLLVGTSTEKIESSISLLLEDDKIYSSMSGKINPYGDGQAAKRIIETILNL
jgi:UDP-N-acetylglucosamine 2-epimerase (non-hydrolysing)